MGRYRFYILLFYMFLTNVLCAQVNENDYKAAFIERVTRFIEWPVQNDSVTDNNPIILTVVGENTFGASLDNLFSSTKIKNREVKLLYTNKLTDLFTSDIVFICRSEKPQLIQLLEVLTGRPILIISDTDGFAEKGAHINLFQDGDHIRYEMNVESLKKSGLRASSLLLSSAKIVKNDG